MIYLTVISWSVHVYIINLLCHYQLEPDNSGIIVPFFGKCVYHDDSSIMILAISYISKTIRL